MNILQFINAYRATTPQLGGNVIPKSFGLPNFQRQFTWNKKQIETLFDSIFNGLPLPLVFEWDVPFPGEVTACTLVDNDPFEDNHFGPNTKLICDGQQRLSSLIIGILNHGTHNVNYRNLFVFLDNLQYANGTFIAKDIFKFKNGNRAHRGGCRLQAHKLSEYYNFFNANMALPIHLKVDNWIALYYPNLDNVIADVRIREHISRTIGGVFKMFEYVLPIKNISAEIQHRPDLALEFFIRINQGARIISRAELIYSICAAELEKAQINLREDLKNIQDIGKENGLGQLDIEYLMRCIIYLHFETLIWKPDVFDANNAEIIAQRWEVIRLSIINAFMLIGDFDLANHITSNNSLIPIMFHFFKTAERTHHIHGVTDAEKRELKMYLIASKFSGVWGNHGDTMLRCLKSRQNAIYQINDPHLIHFNCSDLVNDAHMPQNIFGLPNKSFTLSMDRILDIINKHQNTNLPLVLQDILGGAAHLDNNAIQDLVYYFNFEEEPL